jgi:DVNP family
MTKFSRTSTGKYSVAGKTFDVLIGTRAQVWHGTAYKTTGGLCKPDLMQNKSGRIVSKAKHHSAKRDKRLVKAGFLTKKGHFGFIKKGKSMKKGRKGSRKMKGGMNHPGSGAIGSKMVQSKMSGGMHSGKMVHSKMTGGMSALSPSDYEGQGVGTSGVNLQFVAGNASS